ncbi:MAG TPA: UDP-N-acetylglucosamine 2-epimerase (non-hydrolyzing) [Ignavibacteria bacterium]
MKTTDINFEPEIIKGKKIILFVLGTRPEIIKLFILYRVLQNSDEFYPVLFNSAQQTISDNILSYLDLKFDITADEIPGRSPDLSLFVSHLLNNLNQKFNSKSVIRKEDIHGLIIQGDTASAYSGALWGFLNGIPVFHVEAGLRTFDHQNPFPEEFYRESIARSSSLNFCPTPISYNNLIREGVNEEKNFVVGNTINDAMLTFINDEKIKYSEFGNFILSTLHRRENWNNVSDYARILYDLAKEDKTDKKILHLLHPNPEIRKSFYSQLKGDMPDNLIISEPENDYFKMLRLVKNSHSILSDSGGLQEESLFFNIPCGVMRKVTERPEVLEKNAKLLPFEYKEVSDFLDYSEDYRKTNTAEFDFTYGKGNTSEKIYQELKKFYKI